MEIILRSTTKLVHVNGVMARIWEGSTSSGIKIHAFITRIAAPEDADQEQFCAELEECRPPSADVSLYPLRLIL
jgi:hypothetical protein